jgi:hypothetical protein
VPLFGGVMTQWATSRQHKRQVEKEQHDMRREREHRAAQECEILCLRMAANTTRLYRPGTKPDSAHLRRRRDIRRAKQELEAKKLYLPVALRQRIEVIVDIVSSAQDINYGSPLGTVCHPDSPYAICGEASAEIRALVASFLIGDALPKPSEDMIEYQAALDDLNRDRAAFYSQIDDAEEENAVAERVREEFYSRHPELHPDESEGA